MALTPQASATPCVRAQPSSQEEGSNPGSEVRRGFVLGGRSQRYVRPRDLHELDVRVKGRQHSNKPQVKNAPLIPPRGFLPSAAARRARAAPGQSDSITCTRRGGAHPGGIDVHLDEDDRREGFG
eukprot:CAMPEP_0182855836 /NCGR_PEP_ID=MMETSP0034_2-20130328/2085_1 /TAXON_ID=156128 /ORGANISM="Nephroselmis pyriformis, Strain CCMP717" /LENGTH=124 /DNA_ID=CAMNT_0024986857 /DNA_START=19 /DNA_END=391 /DNA_ORIENTATION=-